MLAKIKLSKSYVIFFRVKRDQNMTPEDPQNKQENLKKMEPKILKKRACRSSSHQKPTKIYGKTKQKKSKHENYNPFSSKRHARQTAR